MALSTFAELKTSVASWLNRTDLVATIPDFVSLAEADMQTRCKLVEFEGTATVTITAGVGALPADYVGMRSIYWNGAVDYPLTYVAPKEFDLWRESTSGDGSLYTISGSTIRTAPAGSGAVVLTYHAKFTALAAEGSSNALLASHPDVYLFGSLKQASVFLKDVSGIGTYGALMDEAVARVRLNSEQRKYGGPIEVRAG